MTMYGQEQFAKYAAKWKYFLSDVSEGGSTGVWPHAMACGKYVFRDGVRSKQFTHSSYICWKGIWFDS